MSQPNQDQEIDLSAIGDKISNAIDKIGSGIYRMIKFIKKKIIVIAILFFVGVILGFVADKTNDSFSSEIVVTPNFGSIDDLYAKIDLLQSRIVENDTVFLKRIGITNIKKIDKIEVEPIIDIYNFVNTNTAIATNAQNTQNFEVVKLLAEDGDINKVLKDKLTSKNYSFHRLKIISDGPVSQQADIDPILKYLNNTPFFNEVQKVSSNNIEVKIKENQIIINQIDGLLNQFSNTTNSQKNDKLVYYNENNQINDIINNKNTLIKENGELRLHLINTKMVIRPSSVVLNQKNTKGVNGKMKLVLPIILILIFVIFSFLTHISKKFKIKYS